MSTPRIAILAACVLTLLAACAPKPTDTNSQASTVAPAKVDFSTRFGVAVRTASRTCIAIQNPSIAPDTPITLINPQAPQNFITAQISSPSSDACPVSSTVNHALTSYKISVPESSIPKLAPLIAYLGPPASAVFAVNNSNVEADLEGTHSRDTFRACSAAGGIYLSAWHDSPLVGTRLWSARYDDAGDSGAFPPCDPKEL